MRRGAGAGRPPRVAEGPRTPSFGARSLLLYLHHGAVAARLLDRDPADAVPGAGKRYRSHVIGDLAVQRLERQGPFLAAPFDLE